MPIQFRSLAVGSLGVFEFAVPVVEIASEADGPHLMFIANQHGNEITPLFVLKELLDVLQGVPLAKGRISVISTANPLGLIFDSRDEPLDGVNLNRLFPGSMQKDLGSRIASCVFHEAQQADLVIDLHTFSRQCPFLGILMASGDEVEAVSSEALRAIAPECVWRIDVSREEDRRFAGALNEILVSEGVPAIALEMLRHLVISPQNISRIVQSLFRLLCLYKMVSVPFEEIVRKAVPRYALTQLYADAGGLFIPSKYVFDKVDQGDILGRITDIRTFVEEPVYSSVSGTLITIRFRDFVRAGSELCSIGEQRGIL